MNDLNIPVEITTQPISEWQLNIVTILFVCQVLGRAYAGLKNGGGLRGVWNGIWFGTNTPKQ